MQFLEGGGGGGGGGDLPQMPHPGSAIVLCQHNRWVPKRMLFVIFWAFFTVYSKTLIYQQLGSFAKSVRILCIGIAM